MTPRMVDFIRTFAWYADIEGPVLEIGSYIEVNQDHLDLRRAFRAGTKYLGVDVLDGPGVDQRANLLDEAEMLCLVKETSPKVILCLYVIEHVWEIVKASQVLAALWKANQESWIFVATHQNQPFHGTDKYGDFWRLTASGLARLMDEVGVPGSKVFVLGDTSNPEDVVAIRQPFSMAWPGEAMTKTVQAVAKSDFQPTTWGQYR